MHHLSSLSTAMDTKPLETHVYVHSPLIEYSSATGGYYTSYAIHLTSNNPCFNRPVSYIRRRYSEFSHFRKLLASHYPTLKPPALPPKNYFDRFNDEFIEQRMKGLQQFLMQVISTSVYLSDKSLHLFLQSTSSMSEIDEECLGDIPAPPLINSPCDCTFSENGSFSSNSPETQHCTRSLHNLVLDEVEIGMEPKITIARTIDQLKPSLQKTLTSSLVNGENKLYLIPKRNGSLDSSATSSPSLSPLSSLETSYSSSAERAKERRVSFNDIVKVAVVTYNGISILRP